MAAANGALPPVGTIICRHADQCAGCPLIHLTYEQQLTEKRERVRRAFSPYAALTPVTIEPVAPASSPTAYRVRAKLMVGISDQGSPVLGLYERSIPPQGGHPASTHRIADIPDCRVLSPHLLRVTTTLRELLLDPPASTESCFVPAASGGHLAAVDLREVLRREGIGVLVTLVLQGKPSPRALGAAAKALRSLHFVVGIAANFREAAAPQVLGRSTQVIWGESLVRDRVGSTYHLATYGSFVQAHRAQAARIEAMIAAQLRSPEAGRLTVLDLYGGSGALSLSLAQAGATVTLVESFGPAALAAEQAAREQDLANFTAYHGDALQFAVLQARQGAHFDAIIANPPRRGLSPGVRAAVAQLEPAVVLYVSCDPDTLARDLDHFSRLGYAATQTCPVDMIPLTDQVETLAILAPAEAPRARVVYEDEEICIVEKGAYQEARAPRAATDLVWSTGREVSGLVVWAKGAPALGFWREVLGRPSTRKIHSALVRGITAAKGSLRGKTRYERVARVGGHSRLEVTVRTEDATSRIQRDFARVGHPIVGDLRHGHLPTNRHFEEKYTLDRPFLHCARLELDHPRTGAPLRVESPLPGELLAVLGRLGHLPSMSRND